MQKNAIFCKMNFAHFVDEIWLISGAATSTNNMQNQATRIMDNLGS